MNDFNQALDINNCLNYAEYLLYNKENLINNKRKEDISDYINEYDKIKTQNYTYNYDNKMITEPIQEVEEENEISDILSLSNKNIIIIEDTKKDNINKQNENENENLFEKSNLKTDRLKRIPTFSRFINIKEKNNITEENFEMNLKNINKTKTNNSKSFENKDKTFQKKELYNCKSERRKKKLFNDISFFEENSGFVNNKINNNITIKNNKSKSRYNSNNSLNNTKVINYNTHNNDNSKFNKINLKQFKERKILSKKYLLNTLTFNHSGNNKNKICLSLIHKNKEYDNRTKQKDINRINIQNLKSLNLIKLKTKEK
jgi:hypothetical protein